MNNFESWAKENLTKLFGLSDPLALPRAAYRAGLLHAAEQDSEKARIVIDIPKFAAAYAESAESHYIAASEVE